MGIIKFACIPSFIHSCSILFTSITLDIRHYNLDGNQ